MLTLFEQTQTEHDLRFKHYGPFTYVTVTTRSKRVRSGTNKNIVNRKPEVIAEFCIARKLYEAKKLTQFFFLDVPREDRFEAISSKFLKGYQAGSGWRIGFPDRRINLHQALKDGKFDRIVKDRYENNHTLLDHNDEIIYHNISFDHIGGQVRDSNHHVDNLVAHLKKRKDIKIIHIMEIPYYNSEFHGERAVEFTYIPPKSGWKKFVSWYYPDAVGGKYPLLKKLGVDKFRKKD
jgi:hypothetical protein